MEKELIIFDLDGTLIDSRDDIARAVNATFAEMGYPVVDKDVIKDNIGWGVRALLEKLLPEKDDATVERARKLFLDHYSENLMVDTHLYDGVVPTLEGLKERGKTLALVTNKPLGLSERIMEGFGIRGYFSAILGGDSVVNKKPHPEPIIKVMELTGFTPERTLYVGDTGADLDASRGAGVDFIAVSYGFADVEELVRRGCRQVIERIDELLGIVR